MDPNCGAPQFPWMALMGRLQLLIIVSCELWKAFGPSQSMPQCRPTKGVARSHHACRAGEGTGIPFKPAHVHPVTPTDTAHRRPSRTSPLPGLDASRARSSTSSQRRRQPPGVRPKAPSGTSGTRGEEAAGQRQFQKRRSDKRRRRQLGLRPLPGCRRRRGRAGHCSWSSWCRRRQVGGY